MTQVHFTRLLCLTIAVSLIGTAVGSLAIGQEKKGANSAENGQDQGDTAKTAALRGKLVVPEKWKQSVKPDELLMQLTENIQMEQPPIPENWNELAPEAQNAWWESFQASEKGKLFIAAQEERFRNRKQFDIRVSPTGEFSVFDVPNGVWDLRGSVRKEAGPYEMLFEVFGELEIEDAVEEVALGEMTVAGIPIFREGDVAPNPELNVDGKPVRLDSFQGKYVLLTFWSAALPPSSFFQKNLQTVADTIGKKHPLQLLSVALDPDTEAEKEFFAENGQAGLYASATLTDPLVEDFGVRSIPWLMLIGPDGKIMMGDQALGIALRTSGLDLAEIVTRKIEGREIPAPPDGETDR